MPSISKSISFMLLAGTTANVFAAPSRRDIGEIINTLDGTSSIANTHTGGDLSGDYVVKDGIYEYPFLGVCLSIMIGGGPTLPGCSTEQTQQCMDKETQKDRDAAKDMCPELNTCDPTQVANVWRMCMIDRCQRDGKCPCSGDDCPKPCKGDECPKPCKGDDCPKPCKGDECPKPCKGDDCPKPCKGDDCPRPCKGDECPKPEAPCTECPKLCNTCGKGTDSPLASVTVGNEGSLVAAEVARK
ncbi:hypothetical protein L218DRAFT_70907 [Marasmius fiardii PR-910]|nr:hypothetical protein L218DRAFT_70907 [Marasmius fiardii PR-910]